MLSPCVHSVHRHKPVGYVIKQEQVPQLLGHKPLQDLQVNDAEDTAAKVAREESEIVTSEPLSKKSVTSAPDTDCKMAAETWAASQVGSSTTPEQDTYKVQYLQQQEKEDNQEQQSPKIVNNKTLQQPREVYAATVKEVCVSFNDNDICLNLVILQTDNLTNLQRKMKKLI